MIKKTILAGGCFWGLEDLIRSEEGVISTRVGYTGGTNDNPSYQNHLGHAEAVEIEYDDTVMPYQKLLDLFFRIHNPSTLNQQGNDIGSSYRSAIFSNDENEKKVVQDFINLVDDSKRWPSPVVTTIEPLTKFYPAEDEHQTYLQKNPNGYTCHRMYFDSYLDNNA